MGALSYIYESDLEDNEFARICFTVGFVWQFACLFSYIDEGIICQQRGEDVTMWIVNIIISLIACIVFIVFSYFIGYWKNAHKISCSEWFWIVFFCLYGIYCWIIPFFFNHTLLQVFSCILGTIYLVFALSFISKPFDVFSGICLLASIIWHIVCIISYIVEIVVCAKRHEAVAMWVVNLITSILPFIVFGIIICI